MEKIVLFPSDDSLERLVIFIHGFMGSPGQFSGLAEAAALAGIPCVCALLPGHGGDARSFSRFGLRDWEERLQEEIGKASRKYKRIYLAGHSMGGLLALNASLNEENRVAGVFLISTPLKINTASGRSLAARLRILTYPKSHPVKEAYKKACGVSGINIFTCPGLLPPALEFGRLIRKTRKNLKQVTAPVYMLHSKGDETTSYKSAELLCAGLSGAPKRAKTLESSRHAYFEPGEREIIRESFFEFIAWAESI